MRSLALLSMLAWFTAAGCNQNVEPFVPGEMPQEPDLAKIFPAGADSPPTASLPPPPGGGRGAPPVSASSGRPIAGTVSLAAEVADRVPADAVLFLIARTAATGPPLAVVRIPDPEFPLEFSIGPEDRMIQAIPFAGPVRISARIDSDGNATTRTPGDLEGSSGETHTPGERDVRVVIDKILPRS